jgi:hypothetical protein
MNQIFVAKDDDGDVILYTVIDDKIMFEWPEMFGWGTRELMWSEYDDSDQRTKSEGVAYDSCRRIIRENMVNDAPRAPAYDPRSVAFARPEPSPSRAEMATRFMCEVVGSYGFGQNETNAAINAVSYADALIEALGRKS